MDSSATKTELTCGRCRLAVPANVEFCPHCRARVGEHRHVPWWHIHRRMYDWTVVWAYRPSASVALFCLAFAESSFFPIPPDVLLMPLTLGNPRRWFRYASLCSLASVLGAVGGFLIGWLLWGLVGNFFHDYVPGFERDRITLKTGQVETGLMERDRLDVEWKPIFNIKASPRYPIKLAETDVTYDRQDVQDLKVGTFTKVGKLYERYSFWIVFTAGFTPIPFKVITITAGIFGTGPAVTNPVSFFAIFLLASIVSRSARFFLVAGLMRAYGPRITPFIDRYFNWLALLFTAMLIGGFAAMKWLR